MAAKSPRVEVPGSTRHALHGARPTGKVAGDERLEVTVRVRRKAALESSAEFKAASQGDSTAWISRERYEREHGADAGDIAVVERFAKEHGLAVVGSDGARRSVFLAGTVDAFSAAFEVQLEHFSHDGGTYRGRVGALTVPKELDGIVEGVFGLDDRPVAKPHFQRYRAPAVHGIQPHAAPKSFTPVQLAKLYDFPDGDGEGQCIAIIELGGGFRPADIHAYFTKLGLAVPDVVAVRVDGAQNHPSTPQSADGEVMLDIDVAAAVAPKAKIAVYFAPNTDKGFLDAITLAVHDKANQPSVISISWGAAESNWTQQSMKSYDQAFQAAAAMGVTVCAAAGDNGSEDGVGDGAVHVDFPASSPFVLGCGGTRVLAGASSISSETVWNLGPDSATGGGFSGNFAVPAWQDSVVQSLNHAGLKFKPGRGVPDVAGDADPETGYAVRVDGVDSVIGGTSAVAPLWAGLVALMNQARKKQSKQPVGYLNPVLYKSSVSGGGAFRDVQTGNNGAWHAGKGWDPCTGWGSPHGKKLASLIP